MSRRRCRSASYRARRALRHAARRQRAAERAAAFAAFQRTPEYLKQLEESAELDRFEELADDPCGDLGTGGRAVCDEGLYCEKHYQEAAAEHAYLRHLPLSAVTGVMGEDEKQQLRDAGRGHLVRS